MDEFTYTVLMDGNLIAEKMDLAHALILAKALFEKYYQEEDISVTIQRNVAGLKIEEQYAEVKDEF